jgi:transposase InsO family protein
MDGIVRLHGLPEEIVSDRGPQFASKFWRRLFELLGVDIRLSLAFHLETDGQIERTNRTDKPDTRAIPLLHCELLTGRLARPTISSRVCL